MSQRIFSFETEGQMALGFDTGLSPSAFAQAKLSNLMTNLGYIVNTSGEVQKWKPSGVQERDGSMVIHGDNPGGTGLDELLETEKALDALRSWILARIQLRSMEDISEKSISAPFPAGAIVKDDGSVFFPPEALVLRSLDAAGEAARRHGADQWVHPDRQGQEADLFTAAAMVYKIFAGKPPFDKRQLRKTRKAFTSFPSGTLSTEAASDLLRMDIREGMYLPLRLAVPEITPKLSQTVDGILTPPSRKNKEHAGALQTLYTLLGPRASGGPEKFKETLQEEQKNSLEQERIRYLKKQGLQVEGRRFFRRNATIITVLVALVFGGILAVRSFLEGQKNRPSTAGLSPVEVVQTYYDSFGALDHEMMDACVSNKAGAQDVDTVMNLYVISKVREAYERKLTVLPADKWLEQGSPETDLLVFGISDLAIMPEDAIGDEGLVRIEASYTLWYPAEGDESQEGASSAVRPISSQLRQDLLTLENLKGLWQITHIDRRTD